MKKTFIFYKDWVDYTQEMSLEEKGLFLQTILNYQTGQELGNIDKIKFVWTRVKKQLDDDNQKRDNEVEERRKSGKLGGIASSTKRKQIQASATDSKQIQPENDNVNDNVNDNETVNDNKKERKITTKVVRESKTDSPSSSNPKQFDLKAQKKQPPIPQPPLFGNTEINLLLETIKKFNNGILDGKNEEQRRFGKMLLGKLQNIDSVKAGKYTWLQIIEMILKIVSENQFHSHKIVGPKKIYYELSGLMMICKQEIQGKKQKEAKEF